MKRTNKVQSIVNIFLVAGILICLNILSNFFYTYIDLTEEKRYTLTKATRSLLAEIKDVTYVKVLLEGNFPAGFKRLQTATKEMLDGMRAENSFIQYEFENPSFGTTEEINARRKELAKDGIQPLNLRVKDNNETKEQLIYPYAIINFGNRQTVVNLLENQQLAEPGGDELALNNSVSLMEYKIANAIQKIKNNQKYNILFTEGHGELPIQNTADLEKSLRQFYNTGRLNLDSVTQLKKEIDILVVAKPKSQFDEKQKFKLDQYVMNGGKIIWLIDRLNADLDSMMTQPEYMPVDYPLNLEDLFFKYGFRVQPNLVLDLECSKIPLRIGQQGTGAQFEMFPWYYHPIVAPSSKHPIVKNLNRVNLMFPSSIDTIKTKTNVTKTILLESSKYSRLQFTPVKINFEVLRYDADPSKFNKPNQPVAVLLEGQFSSLFENRVGAEMSNTLRQIGQEFKNVSLKTKMLVVADGDICSNSVAPDGNIRPCGYNKYMKYVFGNKDFMLNAIEYMLDDKGIIEARTRDVKLRLLDTVRARNEQLKWQLINILLPLSLLAAFGVGYQYWRRRKFASS